ncbi:hypothetical protein PHMEG_00032512, partial [Phytophthora megakarya]
RAISNHGGYFDENLNWEWAARKHRSNSEKGEFCEACMHHFVHSVKEYRIQYETKFYLNVMAFSVGIIREP